MGERQIASGQATEAAAEVREQTCLPNETSIAKQIWDKVHRAPVNTNSSKCAHCHHRHCHVCQEYSAAKQSSDYWICHRCKELNRRVANLYLREVSHGLG